MKKRLFLIGLCMVYLCVCLSLPILAEESTVEPEKIEMETSEKAEDVVAEESAAENSETESEKTITAEAEEIEESENTQADENETKEPESDKFEMIDGIVKLPEKLEIPSERFETEIFDINTAIPEILWESDTKTPIRILVYSRSICYEKYREENEWIPDDDLEKYIKGLSRFTLRKTTNEAYPKTFNRHATLSFVKRYYNPDEIFIRSCGLTIVMRDDVVQINCNPDADGSGATYTVDDPDGFFAYLHEAFPEKPREPARPSTAPDYLNQPYYIPGQEEENGIPVVDKMEFDVVVDDSYYDTVIEELADPGDTIHCTVLQARGKAYFFYLILEGPKKTRKSYFQTTKFDRQRDPRFTFGSIEIFGKATGGDIKNVELRFRSAGTDRIIGEWGKDYYLEKPNPLPAKNFEYELYVNTSMTMYRYLFNEVPEDTGEVELQDPTRYKIDLRADYGKNKWDFDINLATKFNIDTSGFKAPRWAEKIGADEKAEVTFLNIASYANGKYHLDNPAINIKGDKGDTWFWLNSAELRPDNAFVTPNLNDKKTVLLRFGSCISFNGFTVIRNLGEYDSLSVRFVFTDDDKTELDYIEIDFGGNKTVKTDANKINYIGDSKAVYEHWIGGEGL